MKLAPIIATALLGLAQPVAGQSADFECEYEDANSISVGGRTPIKQLSVFMFSMSVDLATKKALFSYQNPDGTPGTTVRDILVHTPSQIVLCQAEACQKSLPIPGLNGASRTFGLTSINLKTGRLSRRVDANIPDQQLGALITSSTIRDGVCRKA